MAKPKKGTGKSRLGTKPAAKKDGLKSLGAFYLVAFGYGALSLVYLIYQVIRAADLSGLPPRFMAVRMFSILWAMSSMNLFSLSRLIRLLFDWNQAETADQRSVLVLPTFFWGSFKFAFLGLIGAMLYVFGKQSQGNPVAETGILLGVSTLAIVPLIGGLSWSIRQRA